MICDKCQTQEATVHFTFCPGSADDGPKHTDLCQQCFEVSHLKVASEPPTDFQASLQAGCRYCGGEFYSGGLDPMAMLGGDRKMRCMCKPCAKEYGVFLRRKLKEQQVLKEANLKAGDFRAIIPELEEHMKEWVAKRKSE